MLMLIFISMTSANALTELTSCGKNSGWIDGETYLISLFDNKYNIKLIKYKKNIT